MSNNKDMVLMTPCELQSLKSKLGSLVVENDSLKLQLKRLEQQACNIKMPEGGKIILVGHGDTSCGPEPTACPSDDAVTVKQKYESNVDTNAFTDEYKSKIDAFVNVNADWDAVDGPAEILNKPTLGTLAAQDGVFSGVSSGVNTGDQTASNLGFTPASLDDWAGGVDPGNTNDALDQLAARVNLAIKTSFSSPAVQNLTNSYVPITGADGVVYQPLWESSIISAKLYIHAAAVSGNGIFHTKFFVNGSEQTAFRDTKSMGQFLSGGIVLKGAFDNTNTAIKSLTFQARNYLTGTHGSKLHETIHWDGGSPVQSVGVMLEITETKN